ncbi:MAG: hypothetical protein PHE58_07545, partial [Candidatus Omnitrophica bacterium]|nr:hypothetical protein [Candidatus Omnitrophota bacterium]
MDSKDIIIEFANSFKKYLNILSFYEKSHPLFLKAVEEFKVVVDSTLESCTVIRIGVTADSLLIEQQKFSGRAFIDLIRRLHLRRIKIIQIKRGITVDELRFLFAVITIPVKDLSLQGGIGALVRKQRFERLIIEELDYSELLKSDSGEYRDVWIYLLGEVVDNDDGVQVSELADNFGKILECFSVREFLDNREFRENIIKFLVYLKKNEQKKFSSCMKSVARLVLKPGMEFSQDEFKKLKNLFGFLTEHDLADILADQVNNINDFNAVSFDLFSRFVSAEHHSVVASLAAHSIQESNIQDRVKAVNKIKKLFTISDTSSVSDVYRNTLTQFLKNMSYGNIVYLDRDAAAGNYRLVLLDLFIEEKNKERMDSFLSEIFNQWKQVVQRQDYEYVKLLAGIVKNKDAHILLDLPSFQKLDREMVAFIENIMWRNDVPGTAYELIEYPQTSQIGINEYIRKIFEEGKMTPSVLKLFLRLFPLSLGLFYTYLDRKYSDLEFSEAMMACLQETNHPMALD